MISRKNRRLAVSVLLIIILILGSTVTAFASATTLSKSTENNGLFFSYGDTIWYNMRIENSGLTYTNTYDDIKDIMPDGTIFILRDSTNKLILAPGQYSERNHEFFYIVKTADVGQELVNTLTASGKDNNPVSDRFTSTVYKSSLAVGAKISIDPLTAENIVGDTHELTATAKLNFAGFGDHAVDEDTEVGLWENVPDDTEIHFEITSGPGSLSAPSALTENGQAKVNLTSSVSGETVIKAYFSYTFNSGYAEIPNLTVTEYTDGTHDNSGPAHKVWVNPNIDIEKLVSVDGGISWEDADSPDGPAATFPGTVKFKVIVTNTGSVPLTDIVVSDSDFTFTGVVGSLAAGAWDESDTITRDSVLGQHSNTADVEAYFGQTLVEDSDMAHYHVAARPDIDLEKYVNDEDADLPTGPIIPVGDTVSFDFVVENTGNVELIDVLVTDDIYGTIGTIPLLEVGEIETLTITRDAAAGQHTNVGTASDGNVSDSDPGNYFGETTNYEGKTPGYWKNHEESWEGYLTDQTLESVFDIPDEYGFDNLTLMEGLNLKGGKGPKGGAEILLRAGVAAILNSAHENIDYPLMTQEVIEMVNEALASASKDIMTSVAAELDMYNNLEADMND